LRHGSRPTAPWNLAMLATLPLAATSGVQLSGADSHAVLAAAAGIGLLVAGCLILRPGWRLAVAGLVSLLVAEWAMATPRCWLAVLPPLLAAAVYLCSMRQCLADIGRLGRPLRSGSHR
jgi:hypothetical protein